MYLRSFDRKLIKVGGPNKSNSVNSSKKTKNKKGSGSSFASFVENQGVDEDNSVGVTQNIGGIDAVLAAQMVEDSTDQESRRKNIKRGEDILDKLEDIRDGILRGFIEKDKLIEIAQFVRSRREQTNDTRLAEILDEIELRAEVEIAKLTR